MSSLAPTRDKTLPINLTATMIKYKFALVAIACLLFGMSYAQQVSIDTSASIEDLIQNNLIQGCVEVSDISSPVNGSVSGLNSFGYFERGNSNFPFENGIILSTGNANSAGNEEITSVLNEGNDTWGTDADLDSALGISGTLNATSIEFNFVSISNQIQFNYILASEEYFANFPCEYSDGFAFLIREAGSNDPFTNIALVPGTNIPVNTTTIHDEIVGFGDGYAKRLNEAMRLIKDSIVVFVYEGVWMVHQQWFELVNQSLEQIPSPGGMVVAGAKMLDPQAVHWQYAPAQFRYGKLICEHPPGWSSGAYGAMHSFQTVEAAPVTIRCGSEIFYVVQLSQTDARFDESLCQPWAIHADFQLQVSEKKPLVISGEFLIKYCQPLPRAKLSDAPRIYEKFKDAPVWSSSAEPMSGIPPSLAAHSITPLDQTCNEQTYNYIRQVDKRDPHKAQKPLRQRGATPLFVVGMHRSGTSMLAAMLAASGVELGDSHPLLNNNEPRSDNPLGHFENETMVRINEALLYAAGGSWYNPPHQASIAALKPKVTALLNEFWESFNGQLLKDPRTALTLQIWQPLSPPQAQWVVCFRNPHSVAQSLHKRDGLTLEHGYLLWYEYNRRLLHELRTTRNIVFVDYDTIATRASETVHGICHNLGKSCTISEVSENVARVYQPKLNHAPKSKTSEVPGPHAASIDNLYAMLLHKAAQSYEHMSV